MIIMAGVVCLLLAAFGVLFFMMWTKISALDEKASMSAEAAMVDGEGVKKIGPIFSLESFIVKAVIVNGKVYLFNIFCIFSLKKKFKNILEIW